MPDRLLERGQNPRSTRCAGGHVAPCSGRRIQRPRRKGVPLPANAIYVGRPTRWGNPFEGRQWGHAKATILHANWLNGRIGALTLERMGFGPAEIAALERLRIWVLTSLHQLAGHDLACWCSANSEWCHAETLRRIAPTYADYERHSA
ncbi:MAG: DUF4326 domain-containing protein [Sphingomonadales bacterium]|nr:DUF4326 domain-containing protein [Sphingomonadales bacterium]MDE2171205.1 DUF4326 domain-containing protein [Sphingomonadales bacterium]